ncbi:dipeptidyl aminopeptidase/acylaminoacyl peptidase [Lipingzhangella halophila]|uniref:Dipeptidyl aminopeptidase/acylaminoacyl peptidase n=1 Tax=Lipingzhangella halophila TaxID=1783352 RepID=A0A7W7REY9_9ACTN|nr:prolyl oligopeptidase family serine peptidase [Lipingzhangella halophila]MBB4930769.1 dipeptidyl aminopeptidase/acylaminoacyl peptidase [Lipingzhangella halophila]
MTTRPLPYGSWPSPIDAAAVAQHEAAPRWPAALAEEVWWAESRPAEGGRVALRRTWLDRPGAAVETVLPAPWNARTRVHEYGGRPYVLTRGTAGPVAVFSEFGDQRLYRYSPGADTAPRPLTPDPDVPCAHRYAELIVGPGGEEVWCVREAHTGPAPTDVTRSIVAVPLDGSAAGDPDAIRTVARDQHFLACPRLSPDGRRLSWISWDHPHMPWEATLLRVATVREGRAETVHTVAGGEDEAVVQAEWMDPATLCCVTDPGGWWNPHQVSLTEDGGVEREPVNLVRRPEEFGGPLWQLGSRWSVPLHDGRIAAVHGRASTRVGLVSPASGEIVDAATPHTEWWGGLALAGTAGDTLLGVAAAPAVAPEVVAVSLTDGSWRSLSRPRGSGEARDAPYAQWLPRPEARVFTGTDERDVHANVYPPHNPEHSAPRNERPPYVVWVHGGPTGRAPMIHDLEVAYFTSRGIGVVAVNYGGSTGFGRAYRERLRANWGIVDVQDCVSVARALVEEGAADPARLAIRGGSAGGWTAAVALTGTSTFRCGTIKFPVLDLVGWRTGETHDFESRYLESLVGPWPQTKQRYEDRSPVRRAESITAPFVLLQGLEDEICPPVQCERFLERLRGRGIPHAYLAFEGEQHGFRLESTIRAALHAELSLYAQVFGFTTNTPTVELRP